MVWKIEGVIFGAAAALGICGCSNSVSQPPFGVQTASSAAPEMSAAIFAGDARFEVAGKNSAKTRRTAWRPGYLVRAIVIQARKDKEQRLTRNLLKVTHVYCGPPKLMGQTFKVFSTDGISSLSMIVWPPPKLGEQGVWSLRRSTQENSTWPPAREIAASGVTASRLPQTYWSLTAPDMVDAQVLAEAVEKVERAQAGEQERLLRAYVRERDSELSEWAIDTLTQWKPQGIAGFFEQQLADPALSIQKQVRFDRALADVSGGSWHRSPRHLQMLRQWVNTRLSKNDGQTVEGRLFQIIYQRSIEPKKGLALFQAFLLNRHAGDWRSDDAYGQFGRLVAEGRLPRGAGFSFLLAQVEHSPDLSARLGAAQGLSGLFAALTSTEAAAIKASQRRIKDELLKGMLQTTLDDSYKAQKARRRRARSSKPSW